MAQKGNSLNMGNGLVLDNSLIVGNSLRMGDGLKWSGMGNSQKCKDRAPRTVQGHKLCMTNATIAELEYAVGLQAVVLELEV